MFCYNNPSISPPQTNEMNPLNSSFEPDQFQYAVCNYSDQFNSSVATQPVDVPIQQSNQVMMANSFYDSSSCLSPIATTVNPVVSRTSLYSASPPSQFEMSSNSYGNEFISRSPESSSSAESNLVSPPQQYYASVNYSDSVWPENIPPPTTTAAPQHDRYYYANHHSSGIKRSASVPHNFHRFKPREDNHGHFQAASPLLSSSTIIPPMNNSTKALPIQIQRISPSHSHSSRRPIDAETYRRQLDEKLEKVNFDDITVAELKEMLRERGLSASGRKAELMNRLREEYELLIRRGGAAAVTAGNATAPFVQQHQQASASSPSISLLHRRVANLSVGSPKKQHHNSSLYYHPYSPPTRHSSISIAQLEHRMASSMPNSYTPSYLNDQFMMKRPSCLRKVIDNNYEDQEQQQNQGIINEI
ncbi:MAG: hypothetical protein EXX96DRAFT_584941 [Benjaminiella poitrasii]|nr:MAG: hypothetical protein EXX96DRAFT_584941 [Benjaminiella poitrasii]